MVVSRATRLRWIGTCLLVTYLIIGTVLFSHLESSPDVATSSAVSLEDAQPLTLENATIEISRLMAFSNVTSMTRNHTTAGLTGVNLVAFIIDPNNSSQAVVYFTRFKNNQTQPGDWRERYSKRYSVNNKYKWSYSNALMFSATVITTIGYGNLSPSTDLGKFFCVLYALIGIPLFAVVTRNMRRLWSTIGFFLERSFKSLVRSISDRCCRQKSSSGTNNGTELATVSGDVNSNTMSRQQTVVSNDPVNGDSVIAVADSRPLLFVLVFLGFFIVVTVPAALFCYLESWDFLSAVYFNLISLSTIGFGDLIAGQNRGGPGVNYNEEWAFMLYHLFLTMWLVLGIPYASAVFELIQMKIQAMVDTIEACCCCCFFVKTKEQAEDDVTTTDRKEHQVTATESIDALPPETVG